jgi:hypothetical protein
MWDVWSNLALLIVTAGIVAIAVEALTEIITSSELFTWIKAPLGRRALPDDPQQLHWYWTMLYKLLSCGYCFSVWAAFGLAWVLPGEWFGLLPWDNLLVKWLLLHRLSNWWHIAYMLYQRGRIVPQDILLKIEHKRDNTQGTAATTGVTHGTD